MRTLSTLAGIVLLVFVVSCETIQQEDLDAWEGMPVEALDTHTLFLTMPMVRTRSSGGIEIRNYTNSKEFASCVSSGSADHSDNYVSSVTFTNCSNDTVVCNNIFYIKDDVVLEYAPTGQCYTDATVQPQSRYRHLSQPE